VEVLRIREVEKSVRWEGKALEREERTLEREEKLQLSAGKNNQSVYFCLDLLEIAIFSR
jgi:hypothetical protein